MHTTVGIRELKNSLSKYVRRAEAGDVIIVTDRGTVVAELVPPGYAASRPDVHPGLLEMERKGLVRLATKKNDPSLYRIPRPKRRSGGETVQEMIDWQRGDR